MFVVLEAYTKMGGQRVAGDNRGPQNRELRG